MAGPTSGRAGAEGPPAAVLERFAAERVASRATLSAAGPRLVPVTFAWHQGTAVWAVDRVKPKRPGPLRRERDLAADPRVAMLVDHYDEDWTQLWWVELQGTAAVLVGTAAEAALDALARRYAPYRSARPPGPAVAVTPRRWALVVGRLTRPNPANPSRTGFISLWEGHARVGRH